MPLPQAGTHGREQCVASGTGQVFGTQLQGVGTATRGAADDDGLFAGHTPGYQRSLGGHGVDGVDDDVGTGRNQRVFGAGFDEIVHQVQGDVRRDVADAGSHGLDLGSTQRAGQRVNLAVDVGFGHVVEIDQCEGADAAAGHRLCSPGTDTADADDHGVRLPQAFAPFTAVDTADGGEAAVGRVNNATGWR